MARCTVGAETPRASSAMARARARASQCAALTHTPLLTTIPSPESALSDGSYVYWVSGARLFRTPVHGTTTSLVDQDGVGGVTAGIVMDAGHVYWVTTASSDCSCMFRIRQVPK